MRPLAQVEQNAEPAAQAVSDQAIRPAGKAVAENAGPAAKSATDSTIRPAGHAVSDNAMPVTKSAMRDQVGSSWGLSPPSWLHACMAESWAPIQNMSWHRLPLTAPTPSVGAKLTPS